MILSHMKTILKFECSSWSSCSAKEASSPPATFLTQGSTIGSFARDNHLGYIIVGLSQILKHTKGCLLGGRGSTNVCGDLIILYSWGNLLQSLSHWIFASSFEERGTLQITLGVFIIIVHVCWILWNFGLLDYIVQPYAYSHWYINSYLYWYN